MAHHFADDTNVLSINKSPKRLNKLINIELNILQNGLMPIKIFEGCVRYIFASLY